MENLKLTNSIAIIIPLFLGVLGIVEPISLYFAAYSTMLTGLLQIIVGIFFWKNHKGRSKTNPERRKKRVFYPRF